MSELIKEYLLKFLCSFVGVKDFEVLKKFYLELGFEIIEIDFKMCLVKVNDILCFYF